MPRWSSFDSFLAEAQNTDAAERQPLVDALMAERPVFPWIGDHQATFAFIGNGVERVALNLDTIQSDPPFAPFTHLEGTNFWYVTREFENDDLLDYLLAVDDPMTPLANDPHLVERVMRHWRTDPLNPTRMDAAQTNVSVLRMAEARPFPNWAAMSRVPHGRVIEVTIDSEEVGFKGRRLSVYTPPGYEGSGLVYPLLIMHDGQWANGPLQVPYIADALIKHHRMQPSLIAMVQSGTGEERNREYGVSDAHYLFLLTELLPMLQTNFRVDSTKIGVGGVALGAVAAAHAALRNPAVFSRLILISPPLGKGANQDQLRELINRFEQAEALPERIFQSVGRYEARARFYRPAQNLRDILSSRRNVAYEYAELGSGHGLVGFRAILPEALAWTFPDGAG